MKRWVVGLAALCLFSTANSAQAYGYGGCYPGQCYTYVTEYRKVQRTICECVPVTVYQDCCEVVCVPCKQVVNRTECYYETCYETVPVKTCEYVCDWVNKCAKVCVCRPVTKYVQQTYCVKVPVTTVQKCYYNVCVPVKRVQEVVQPVCTYECVPVTSCVDVCTYQTVPVACPSPCGPCCGSVSCCYQCVPVMTKQYYTTYQTVCKTAYQKYCVEVCDYQTQTVCQDVQVCSYVDKVCTQTVPVCSYENVWVDQQYCVPVVRPVEKVCNVTYCKLIPKYRTYPVEVCTYQYQNVTVKKPVCTYQWVQRCIEECVPVTVCVPCAPSPCYAPAPCCY